jgi:hypothetical protein
VPICYAFEDVPTREYYDYYELPPQQYVEDCLFNDSASSQVLVEEQGVWRCSNCGNDEQPRRQMVRGVSSNSTGLIQCFTAPSTKSTCIFKRASKPAVTASPCGLMCCVMPRCCSATHYFGTPHCVHISGGGKQFICAKQLILPSQQCLLCA